MRKRAIAAYGQTPRLFGHLPMPRSEDTMKRYLTQRARNEAYLHAQGDQPSS